MRARIAVLPLLLLLGAPADASSLDKRVIQRPITAAVPRIQRCYQLRLAVTPTLEDKVVVKFSIVDGRVTDATGSGTDDTLARCVTRVIRTLRFPRSPSKITVSYPFTFHP